MKILILTKIKRPFLKGRIRGVEDYIQNDHAFEGWYRGFKELGHQPFLDGRSSFFIPLAVAYQYPRLFFWLSGLLFLTGFFIFDRYLLSRSVENRAVKNKIDLIFSEINPFLSISSIKRMKRRGIAVTEWFGVFPEMVSSRKLRQLNHLSHIWSFGDIGDEFKRHGVVNPNIHFIGPSVNEKFSYPDFDPSYAYDVCFVGGVGRWHSSRVPLLERVAKEFENFAFYGYGIGETRRNSPLRKKYKGWADHQTMRKVYSSSKIAINLTLDGYEKVKRGFNARSIEIAACGGALQVSVFHKNIREFFHEDEIVCFQGVDDLISKIRFFLKNEDKRKSIVQKALDKTKHYTYSKRVSRMMEIVQKDRGIR